MSDLGQLRAQSDVFQEDGFLPADVLRAASVEYVDFIVLLLNNRAALIAAATALEEAHDRICGCDRPGQHDVCTAGPEFAALNPFR